MSQSKLSNISSKELGLLSYGHEAEISEQLASLLMELKISKGSKILEVDGTGLLSSYLASKGFATTVTNFSKNVIEKAKEYYEKNNLQGNFKVLDIFEISEVTLGEKFDAAFITEILDHYDSWQVIQVLERMKGVAGNVIVLSQNPNCIPAMLYYRTTIEKDGLKAAQIIFRETFADLAKLAGLEVDKETFFSAPNLTEWMASKISPEIHELYADAIKQNLVPKEQGLFRVLSVKRSKLDPKPEETITLYEHSFKSELEALRKVYNFDIQILARKISDLELVLVERNNIIKQLELTCDKENSMVNTPIGLLLSLYFERTDLQQAFPEVLANHDYRRLLKWAQDTVNGKTGDYNTGVLKKYSDWYNKTADEHKR